LRKSNPRIWGKIAAVFDSYWIRAKLILFLARLESGTRVAEMIDLDDLLAGLIIEDQNERRWSQHQLDCDSAVKRHCPSH
jgi:hypothetical protein